MARCFSVVAVAIQPQRSARGQPRDDILPRFLSPVRAAQKGGADTKSRAASSCELRAVGAQHSTEAEFRDASQKTLRRCRTQQLIPGMYSSYFSISTTSISILAWGSDCRFRFASKFQPQLLTRRARESTLIPSVLPCLAWSCLIRVVHSNTVCRRNKCQRSMQCDLGVTHTDLVLRTCISLCFTCN